MGMNPTKVLENSIELKVGNNTYVIPLKDKKVNVSFRVLPEAIKIIDRFCGSSGNIARSKLLERIVEILALLVMSAKYEVKSITMVVTDKNGMLHQGSIIVVDN